MIILHLLALLQQLGNHCIRARRHRAGYTNEVLHVFHYPCTSSLGSSMRSRCRRRRRCSRSLGTTFLLPMTYLSALSASCPSFEFFNLYPERPTDIRGLLKLSTFLEFVQLLSFLFPGRSKNFGYFTLIKGHFIWIFIFAGIQTILRKKNFYIIEAPRDRIPWVCMMHLIDVLLDDVDSCDPSFGYHIVWKT